MRAAHPEPAWWTTWHVWKRILQIAAAITGLSYLQINYRQWQTAIDANRLALQNAIRDQRPYVVCNGMTNKSHFAQGEYSYWIIGISNSGKSPAVRCSGHFAMGIGDPATLARDADR